VKKKKEQNAHRFFQEKGRKRVRDSSFYRDFEKKMNDQTGAQLGKNAGRG